jgi:hypothetical protein
MQNQSFIYRNVLVYRLVMNLLYSGGYWKRFKKIENLLERYRPLNVLELCFADTHIAVYCKKNNIQWQGVDINSSFVNSAIRNGYSAWQADLTCIKNLPNSDVVVMSGSLYHFHQQIHALLELILSSTHNFVLSEPIKNISSGKGIIGRMAHLLSNAGKGKESFRYNETSLMRMLEQESKLLYFSYEVIDYFKKDILIVIKKK